jgi:ribosomal protein S18 acetylase RimI-like enzyme
MGPHHNGVLRATVPERGASEAIEHVLAPFRARGLPMFWWWFTPLAGLDPAVDAALRAHRLTLETDFPGMGRALAGFEPGAPPAGVAIERVRDRATFREWAAVVARAFDSPDYPTGPSVAGFLARGFADDAPFRHHLARERGVAVAAATVSLGAGVAGLANVAVIRERRRRGIGRAISSAALAGARERGVRLAVLSAGAEGVRLYESLGFRAVCRHLTYVGHGSGR